MASASLEVSPTQPSGTAKQGQAQLDAVGRRLSPILEEVLSQDQQAMGVPLDAKVPLERKVRQRGLDPAPRIWQFHGPLDLSKGLASQGVGDLPGSGKDQREVVILGRVGQAGLEEDQRRSGLHSNQALEGTDRSLGAPRVSILVQTGGKLEVSPDANLQPHFPQGASRDRHILHLGEAVRIHRIVVVLVPPISDIPKAVETAKACGSNLQIQRTVGEIDRELLVLEGENFPSPERTPRRGDDRGGAGIQRDPR
jgi:hypothetical protein